MTVLAYIIFGLHALFEITFGVSAFLSGASSSQSAAEIAAQPTHLSIAFRFQGSALIALGVLGALVLFVAGVRSQMARLCAVGFAVFHGLGAAGSVYTAAPGFEVYSNVMAMGAVGLHGILALGFVILAIGLKPEAR